MHSKNSITLDSKYPWIRKFKIVLIDGYVLLQEMKMRNRNSSSTFFLYLVHGNYWFSFAFYFDGVGYTYSFDVHLDLTVDKKAFYISRLNRCYLFENIFYFV